MKARQIAIAIRSVYALDQQQRVRFIERDSDGLWGAWQDAGAEARQIVHEGDVVARIGLDRRVSVLQRTPRLPWQDLDLEADGLAVTRMHDGAPALFASDGDNLAIQDWPLPEGLSLRGVIVLVHGVGEHAGRYDPLAQRLNSWGFAVRGYDHYGHGESNGKRG